MICNNVSAELLFTGSTGFSIGNEINKNRATLIGGGLHLLYPISDKSKIINTELGVANWYNYYLLGDCEMQTIRFGLGIRVFLNSFQSIRPYFTHDILNQIVLISNREGTAHTLSINLGLGINIPHKGRIIKSNHIDISYSRFNLGYFEIKNQGFSFMTINIGFTL
jgi:hypothetical protein